MATFVHRLALCESDSVGDGTRIWAFAHVMHGAVVGRDCNIGDHAFIESGAVVGDRVTVKNGVLIWDGVTIADEAFIGPGVIFTNDRHPRSPRMPAAAALRRASELAERNARGPRRQHRRRRGDHAGHFDRRIRNDRRRRGRHSRRAASFPCRRLPGPRDRLGVPMRPTIVHSRPLRLLRQSPATKNRRVTASDCPRSFVPSPLAP